MKALAALVLAILSFGSGYQVGRQVAHAVALSAAEDARYETAAATVEVLRTLERETAADPEALQRIVREPFARRGLLP